MSLGRVQSEIVCNLRCNSHGVNEDVYAEYNFDDNNCICHLRFIGMIPSSENVAICKTVTAGNVTFNAAHSGQRIDLILCLLSG